MRKHHYAKKLGGRATISLKTGYEENAAHDVNNQPTTMEGFHPGPTSISRSSVTWRKTTPFHRRQKETTREKRKRKNKEREKRERGKERKKGKSNEKRRFARPK